MKTTDKLARQLVVGLEGNWPTPREWAWIKQWQPFGIILFSRNVENFSQLKQLCSVLKDAVPDLQIFADHEGGPVSQMAGAVGRPPVVYQLGVLDDTELTRRVHFETGKRLLAAGLDWVLAPCADILSEKRNPVIGARSFGSDGELVSRHVDAAVRGLLEAGISCCLKHWPGHGSSTTDSHLEATALKASAQDELPFLAGLNAGAHGVMPGHLLVNDGQWPATLSKEFLEETRHRLGGGNTEFKLIADDVSMGALRLPMERLGVDVPQGGQRTMVDVDKIPLAWFEHLEAAGCDIFLIRSLPVAAFPLGKEEPQPPRKASSWSPSEWEFRDGVYNLDLSFNLATFADGYDNLFCLDLARNDRWQVAGGQGPGHWLQWDRLWADHFCAVLKVSRLENPPPGDGSISRLLVTSHRPMPAHWFDSIWGSSLGRRICASGECLVMGHPSLEDEFKGFLGVGWGVTSMYDISYDLFAED